MYRFRDHLQKKDKGSVLLEAVVSLGIISMLTLGYTATATSATITQRTAVNDSIATQVSQSVFETARATPWSKIGTKTKPAAGLLPSAAGEIYEAGDELAATGTKTVRGLKVTVKTAVGWQDKPDSDSIFGTKVVVVDVSWLDNEADPGSLHSRRETSIITPGIGEAAPSGVRSGTEAPVQDPPKIPTLSGSIVYEGPKAKATWGAVANADGYSLQYRINGGSWVTKNYSGATRSALIDGAYGDKVEMQLKATGPSGSSYYGTPVTVLLPVPPGQPVVTGVAQESLKAVFTWPAVPTATSYWVEKRVNGGAWTVVASAQTARTVSATSTPGSSVEVRVRANLHAISGPYSTVSKVILEALAAPPVITGKADSATAATFTWPAVSKATGYRVEKQVNSGAWTVVSATTTSRTATVTGTGGNTLKLRVQSLNGAGASAYSKTASVVLPNTPANPVVSGKLDPATEAADFTWPAVPYATTYRVEYKYGSGAWTLFSASSKTTSAKVSAKGNTLVTVRVRADNTGASSSWSNSAAVTTPNTPIGWKYELMNGAKVLGKPTEPETASIRGGKYRIYEKGAILWNPSYGAFASVNGPIRTKHLSAGGHKDGLGFPLADEITGLKDGGSSQEFEGGTIVWSKATGAIITGGGIRVVWGNLGGIDGFLGYPQADELVGLKEGGAYQNFQGGSILWHPKYGAHAVNGAIGGAWHSQGSQNGPMGYPTSNEYIWNGMIRQNFQGGYYTFTANGGVKKY